MSVMNESEIKNHHADKMGVCLAEVWCAIYQEVTRLHLRWREYLTLYGEGNDHIELMNRAAPNFFGMIQEGLRENIILHIARLTDAPYMGRDEQHQNLSIKLFPELIEDMTLKATVDQLICFADAAAEPCRASRHKWHAHRDWQIALDSNAEPLPEIQRQDIDESINAMIKILDLISTHYHNTPTSTLFVPESGGARTLLDNLESTQRR